MPLSAFLPSYQELFGDFDVSNGDESRSVYSPAAYLADLLELIERSFAVSPLGDRRPDLQGIALDGDNSYTVLPYLDIVNEVLERRVGKDPDGTLSSLSFPLNLPFSMPAARLRSYLRRLRITPEDLYRQFAIRVNADVVAREYLGLTTEDVNAITVPVSGHPERFALLADAERFRHTTTLTSVEVRELLYQNLGPAQRSAATAFFIHQGGTCVTLAEDEKRLLWGGPGDIPEAWYDRVARLVRLARKTGMSLSDLDLILRTCCGNQLNAPALRTIAAINVLQRGFDLPVDVVCALAAPVNTLGLGDEDRPANLATRLFGTPPTYTGDILAEANKPYRRWLTRVLPLTEPDIVAIVKRFRARPTHDQFDRGDNNLRDLSLLHRIGCLTTTLGIDVDELFGLLDALESDPTKLKFPVPIHTGATDADVASAGGAGGAGGVGVVGGDCYWMLDGGEPGASLWLMQVLLVAGGWMRAHGLASDELVRILGGASAVPTQEDVDSLRDVLEQVRARFDSVALTPGVFTARRPPVHDSYYGTNETPDIVPETRPQPVRTVLSHGLVGADSRFSWRAAEVIHRVVSTDGVVSGRDSRLVRVERAAAEEAAYRALVGLGEITEHDFHGLGLDARLTGKIFTNLVLRGYLDGDGELVEDQLTEDPALTTDFGELSDAVFDVLGELSQNQPASVYPSDLAEVADLTDEELTELYDNLAFNGHIDADGTIGDTTFFANPDNAEAFTVNADLSDVEQPVLDRLRKRSTGFKDQRLTLDPEIFDDVNVTDLLASLRFNGYIDTDNHYVDKAAVLTTQLADFGLALELYPYRQRVLQAMQSQIEDARSANNTFAPGDFQDIAEDAMARRVVALLSANLLVDGHVPEELRPDLADPDPGLWLGPDLSGSETATVFQQVAAILVEQQAYQLDFGALTDLEFSLNEIAELVGLLISDGHLTEDLTIPENRLDYFTNVHNALTFSLTGFEDYNTDLFFLLNAVATELKAGIAEIADSLAGLADNQTDALFSVLQDALGIDADTVEATCLAVTGSGPDALDALVAPVLAVTGDVTDAHFRAAYRRIQRFALLIGKFALTAAEVGIAFQDQDLVGKFPEPLTLPPGVDRFDALLEDSDGTVYVFGEPGYWVYKAVSYALQDPHPKALTELSGRFTGMSRVDAAFTDSAGTSWVVGHGADGVSRAVVKEKGSVHWTHRDQVWGRIKNNFTDPERIDTAFVDVDGRTYLFCGDQYVRYSTSNYTVVDEGYPRTLGEWREDEGPSVQLAASYTSVVDASFQDADGNVHLFKEDRCLTIGGEERLIADVWGQVRNSFDEADQVDAAYTDGSTQILFSGNQVVGHSDSIENSGVRVDDGWPRRIETLLGDVPPEFENAVDAALLDGSNVVHLFKDGKTVALGEGQRVVEPTAQRWGVVGPVLPSGTVDAAFVGLDGKTYLFSGNRYIRYSTADYSVVDSGYPRLVAGDWGGLSQVTASVVLDGRTYLFGTAGGTESYVRYSTRNYTTPDEGYPKPLTDNWWNLPAELASEFTHVDAVFTGRDKLTYLFSGGKFVLFDSKHRWWSEPKTLLTDWDSIPFERVDAAFLGNDGKTYVFYNGNYVRYSGTDHTRVDDRYPAPITPFWGNVVNNIARTGKVDATLVIGSDPKTYLFSGNQFVRYTGYDYATVDNGYPKTLAALKDEPRFANLDVVLDRVDAALADQHTVYLFTGRDCHAVSDMAYRRHDLPVPSVGCAFIENGSVVVAEADGWRHYSSLEGKTVTRTPFRPRTLRTVPPEFRDGLDTVLAGTDNNTYLFKGTNVFNTRLGHFYPLAEEWGRSRNNVYDNNEVDAAFVGRDNKTYVFSGDQFVVYTGTTYLDAEIDGEPRLIADHWPGLDRVRLAYVLNGRTLLFGAPDADGVMPILVYSGTDYTRPDDGFPTVTDSSFWTIPEPLADFVLPDAVLTEGDTPLLITGDTCLQLNETTGEWTRPRPVNRIWPGLGEPVIRTAFTGRDTTTYFFFKEEFTGYHDRTLAPRQQIRDRWGRARNEFAGKDGAGRVHAAVVVNNKTFVFSSNQFVRYSGADYRYVDAGYPKPIAGNLRAEAEFAQLPESFEDVLSERVEANASALIDAVVAGERDIYFFIGSSCHVVSRTLTATYDISSFGQVRNNIVDKPKVDAALVANGRTFLFSGDQYVRYSGIDHTYVDDGYPRTLDALLSEDLGITTLPDGFRDSIDAAFHGSDHVTYLFSGKQFLHSGKASPVKDQWGKVHNQFDASNAIDAAFVAPDGSLYAFRGRQFVRYEPGVLDYAEEGYPRTIKDDWGDLPTTFETGVNGAFVFEGRTYLVRDDQYVRYSDDDYDVIDRTYPQAFRDRWANTADYRLTDIHTILRFIDLARAHAPGVAEFLMTGNEDPYGYLSGVFGWDADELKWLKRHGGFLPSGGAPEYRFELEFLLHATEVFDLAGKLGSGPSRIFADIWSRVYGDQPALDDANTALYALLEQTLNPDEWKTAAEEIHDELNLARRDALMSVVTSGGQLVTSRDLFEHLLIDVDMGSAARTSRIREAIAAAQLYLHRYLLNLEDAQVRDGSEADTRSRLKQWWTWMRAYRTWEANRKVFLYPENYIRPELRSAKTPAFQQLQDDLLQGEITPDTVLKAYKRYLDEYTEVSRLAIAGGYVYPKEGADEHTRDLVLFGTTRTDPRRYYYRYAEVRGLTTLSTTWQPWAKVGVQIDADDVSPIHAFGRVFVFWAMPESTPPDGSSATIVATKDGDTQHVSSKPATNRVKICFSFRDLNGEWLPVQSRSVDTGLTGPMPGLKVSVQLTEGARSEGVTGDKHESIVVTCTCVGLTQTLVRWTSTFALPPELTLTQLSATTVPVDPLSLITRDDADLLADLFDPGAANRIKDARVVGFNSTTGDTSWFSIDHRGGSFLFRPSAALEDEDIKPSALRRNKDRVPGWDKIDAAVELPDGERLFFSNAKGSFTTYPLEGEATNDRIRRRFGLPSVTGAYFANSKLFLVSDTQLACYTPLKNGALPERMDEGYPHTLPHAVTGTFQRGGQLYLFGAKQYTRIDAKVEPGTAPMTWRQIRGNWGGLPEAFDSQFDTILDSKDSIYLFKDSEYVQYDKASTFPQPYDRTALSYEIVRLTTSTAHKLNERLLTGGVGALLDPHTQEYNEVPAFSTQVTNETTIHVNKYRVPEEQLPASTHLDFDSANGIYYWEIFFHAPLLIAQALSGAQRFEDARRWYEYVFDPTQPGNYWRFLPFLALDPTALADSIRQDLFTLAACTPEEVDVLAKARLDAKALGNVLDAELSAVDRVAPLFRNRQPLTRAQQIDFARLSTSTTHVEIEQRLTALTTSVSDAVVAALIGVREKAALIAGLPRQYTLLGDSTRLIEAYQEDPFDPHRIAELRPVAYRRAVVMSYVDNLLDWGDMLFRQYTPESVDEARMLYIFAYDLLGTRPEALGTQLVPAAQSFTSLEAGPDVLDPRVVLTGDGTLLQGSGEVHGSVANPYFSIPGNSVFADYWVRVEDRLRKIRLSENILGVSQPLPLFAPPIDPMALVEGAAMGADLSRLGQGATVPVPAYRFEFVFRKAQDLVDKLRMMGSDLVSVLERGDGEALGLLHNRQEGVILGMTRTIKDAEVKAAEEAVEELKASKEGATKRLAYYEKLVNDGLSPLETAQITMMSVAVGAQAYSGINRVGAAFAYAMPQALLGPFIMGVEEGGEQAGKVFDKSAEIWESIGQSFNTLGELLGIRAGQERSMADWRSQKDTAESDLAQIGHQLTAAQQRLAIAQRERDVNNQEIAHNQAEATFLTGKFSNAQLYTWMSGRLADTYFQVYNLAYDLAKSAERAYQFERGADGTTFVRPSYWDSRRNGLLAGEGLGLDLELLGRAYLDQGDRGMEITKRVSLLELDPVALLRLKNDGNCDFTLTEALFDYDFPGHFRRQIRTVTVTFLDADGNAVGLNATLSQLGHKTVMAADPKAVKQLLDPKGPLPATVRADWRAGQRIVLSQVDDDAANNGLFDLRFDDDRYLPFEGTGAVSNWRLELAGRRPANLDLTDVMIIVRYTAQVGDQVFTNAVRGMLKTYPAARFLDVASQFPDEWGQFVNGDEQSLTLPITPELFPNMSTRQITGIYPKYELANGGSARFTLNGDSNIPLTDGKLVPTPGLRLRGDGESDWTLVLDGDKEALTNLGLVLTYKAGV